MTKYKVWVTISAEAVRQNIKKINSLLRPKTSLWAVVKSNAYGHGLLTFSQLVNKMGADGFCVDSVVEGLKLRETGITKPVLVLGPTLFPELFKEAAVHDVTVTIATFEALTLLLKNKLRPKFHLKIDTGMRRQGFYLKDLPKVIKKIRTSDIVDLVTGVCTHFASAKDVNYPTFTDRQFEEFQKAARFLHKHGLKHLVQHCAATGATLINPKYHLDAVRVGTGLYGLWPSSELATQLGNRLELVPALSWQSLVSEIKDAEVGDYVGYDLTERLSKKTKLAVIPIGYWHGYDRGLSGIGEVLIRGRRCRVVGRVSMDLIVVDATGTGVKVGDTAALIGRQKSQEVTAYEVAQKGATTHYEVVTRINPLIERVIVR